MTRLSILSCLVVLIVLVPAPGGQGYAQTAEDLINEFAADSRAAEELQKALAAQAAADAEAPEPAPIGDYTSGDFLRDQVENNMLTVGGLFVLAILSLTLVLYYMNKKPDCTARDIVDGSALVTLVYGTIILALVVNTDKQLMAAVGILGAIAGYLFGSAKGIAPAASGGGGTVAPGPSGQAPGAGAGGPGVPGP